MSIIEGTGYETNGHVNGHAQHSDDSADENPRISGLERLKRHRAAENEIRASLMEDLRNEEDTVKAAQAKISEIRAELGLDNEPTPNRKARRAAKSATPRKRASVAPASTTKPKAERMTRRSDDEIAGYSAQLVALLADKPEGLRAEEIRAALKLGAKELPRILAYGLESKAITKTGQKRASRYYAVASESAS